MYTIRMQGKPGYYAIRGAIRMEIGKVLESPSDVKDRMVQIDRYVTLLRPGYGQFIDLTDGVEYVLQNFSPRGCGPAHPLIYVQREDEEFIRIDVGLDGQVLRDAMEILEDMLNIARGPA